MMMALCTDEYDRKFNDWLRVRRRIEKDEDKQENREPLTYKTIKKAINQLYKNAGKPVKPHCYVPGGVIVADTYEELKQKMEEYVRITYPDEAAEE